MASTTAAQLWLQEGGAEVLRFLQGLPRAPSLRVLQVAVAVTVGMGSVAVAVAAADVLPPALWLEQQLEQPSHAHEEAWLFTILQRLHSGAGVGEYS